MQAAGRIFLVVGENGGVHDKLTQPQKNTAAGELFWPQCLCFQDKSSDVDAKDVEATDLLCLNNTGVDVFMLPS